MLRSLASRVVCSLVIVASGAVVARASEGPPPVLNIKTYTSPSGEYAITVDPSTLLGAGPGHYIFKHAGKEEWSKDLPYTLWEADITDSGVVAGYAYTLGWRGMPEEPGGEWNGQIITAILAPDGSERLKEAVERDQDGGMHAPQGPTALGSLVDAANDRLIVRYRGGADYRDHSESWKAYQLSSGKALPDLRFAAPAGKDDKEWFFCSYARSLGATGLTAVFFSHSQWGDKQVRSEGLRLALYDKDLKEVWSLDRPEEFKGVKNFVQWAIPWADLLSVKSSTPDGATIELRSPADQARITYALARDKDKPGVWTGSEASRAPEPVSVERNRTQPASFAPVVLESRGVLTLQDTGSDAPALHVFDFAFDDAGRIGFITFDSERTLFFKLYTSAGELAKSIALPADAGSEHRSHPALAWVGGSHWVAVQGSYDKSPTTALAIDADAQSVKPIDGFDGPKLSTGGGIVGYDGGFALLGNWEQGGLHAYDASGKKLWMRDRIGISPQDVAVGPRGFAVLSGIDNLIVEYDRAGEHKNTIKLESALGTKPNYVTHLSEDRDGGWLLQDFNGVPPVYRLDAAGKPLASFAPKYPDGNTFVIMGGVVRAPGKEGAMWTSDGSALLRLDEKGVVDKVVGRSPTAESLGELRVATIDTDGTIYAVDGRNAWVHVYDPAGKHQRVLKPQPGDFTLSNGGIGSITLDEGKNVYYRPDPIGMGQRGYMKLRADGARDGFQASLTHDVREDWCFRPGSNERLVLGYHKAFWTDAEGKRSKTFARRADRKWLEEPYGGAVAADGSFAIFAIPSGWNSSSLPSVTLFTKEGEPARTVELPDFSYGRLAYDGRFACAISTETLVIIDARSGNAQAFAVPAAGKKWFYPFIPPGGKEVWLLDSASKSFARYALPQD